MSAGASGPIRSLIESALDGTAFVVDDVDVTPAGKRRVVRVAVDRDLGPLAPDDHTSTVPGLDLDEVADATRVVGAALDDSPVMGETPYVLEVTSPGVSRPLTLPRHFRRNVGRLVEVETSDGARVTARLTAADADGVTVLVPATKKEPEAERSMAYGDIARAQVQVEFSRHDDQQED